MKREDFDTELGREGAPVASIVIPAHNESAVIGRCLRAVAACGSSLEVIVVCNGCTDATAAETARVMQSASVIELPEASKVRALNAGDHAVTTFPRLFVDADVELSAGAVATMVEELAMGEVLAVSPSLELDLSESSWVVRSYSRIWSRLPDVRDSIAGRGVYGLSEEGRKRFGSFPDLVADDQFVNKLFIGDERRSLEGCSSRVTAPRTYSQLIRRKVRVFRGNRELRQQGVAKSAGDNLAWLRVVRESPLLVFDVPAYLAVTLTAKLSALLRPNRQEWERDESSRDRRIGGVGRVEGGHR